MLLRCSCIFCTVTPTSAKVSNNASAPTEVMLFSEQFTSAAIISFHFRVRVSTWSRNQEHQRFKSESEIFHFARLTLIVHALPSNSRLVFQCLFSSTSDDALTSRDAAGA